MAGHSKWAQIKRQKAVTDAQKSKAFSKFAREITLEAKKAAGNLSSPALQSVIARAKALNMPKENIDRAVARGTDKSANDLERVTYELFGPGGVAMVVLAVTDSRNRTTQEIKHLLSKNGYALGAPGSAMWAFTQSVLGHYTPNEPLAEVADADGEALSSLMTLLDEYEDVQEVFTNARGYEGSRE